MKLFLLFLGSLLGRWSPAPATAPSASALALQLINAPLPDYAVYTLASGAGSTVLTVLGDRLQNQKYAAGQLLAQDTLPRSGSPSDWQQWYVAYVLTSQGTRYYQLRNVFSGQLLSAPSASAGTQVQQLPPASGGAADRQFWAITQVGSAGPYQLVNRSTGLALAGPATPTGAVTQQLPLGAAAGQQWAFTAQPLRVYRDELANGFFARNGRHQGSVAFDEGMSIPLSWGPNQGKVVWVTQDAFDGVSNKPGGGLYCGQFFSYSNSLLLQSSLTDWSPTAPNIVLAGDLHNRRVFHNVPTSVNQQALPYDRPWPSVGIEVGNHVFVQCGEGRYDNQGPGSQSLYDFTESADSVWTAVRTVPQGLGVGVGVGFVAGMTHAPGELYVYAYGSVTTSFGYGSDLHVARFLASNPQGWEFWNGPALGWQPTLSTAVAGRVGTGKGSNAVGYVNGKYVLISLSQGYNCADSPRAVYVATACSPTGPFSALQKVYDIQEYYQGQNARYYTPGVHPEFVNGHNELLLSYCLNFSCAGGSVNNCVNGQQDPYFYRLKTLRVPYSLLGIPADPAAPLATAASAPAGNLACYPNPARGSTTLDLRGLTPAMPAQLTLFDALGRHVRQVELPATAVGSPYPLALPGLASGSYQLQVEQNGRRYRTRLLLEH